MITRLLSPSECRALRKAHRRRVIVVFVLFAAVGLALGLGLVGVVAVLKGLL